MVGRCVNPLFFAGEVLKFFQAEKISHPSIAFPIPIGFVVIGVVDGPGELRNGVDDAQEESENSIQPCCFK